MFSLAFNAAAGMHGPTDLRACGSTVGDKRSQGSLQLKYLWPGHHCLMPVHSLLTVLCRGALQGFCCLMQLSTRSEDFLVDVLALRRHVGPVLAPVFANTQVLLCLVLGPQFATAAACSLFCKVCVLSLLQ